MSRDEVLQYAHTFLEVGENRVFNNLRTFCTSLLRLSHQTTHTGQLGNLIGRTTGTGIQHHKYGIETLVSFRHLLHQGTLQIGIGVRPGINNLVVTLIIGDETHIIIGNNLVNLLVTLRYDVLLLLRDNDII